MIEPHCIARLSMHGKANPAQPMVPSSLAWHPRAPHDRLVVGCWNACCVVVQYVSTATTVQDRLQVCEGSNVFLFF